MHSSLTYMCNNQINLLFLYKHMIYVNIKCIYVIYTFFDNFGIAPTELKNME